MYDNETFEHGGRMFRFKTEVDEDMGPPWKEHDGHGPVREVRSTDIAKRPGERVLKQNRWGAYLYDFAEATRIAKRDGWGLSQQDEAALARLLGRAPTRKQIVREAVIRDFNHLRGWLNDDWQWLGVIVTHVDGGRSEALWGIDGDGPYLEVCARELADQLNHYLDTEMAAEIAASRPDMTGEARC